MVLPLYLVKVNLGKYSPLLLIRTFKGNRKKFELSGVQVIKGNIIFKMI